ncbi:heterokaryon incompatibility protein-domain-containing protein [Hypoxylon sp. NC1633]|nr:heterokaryon incompatibility protein-domain-containing protein [Hypoxylon sp. NC1633]
MLALSSGLADVRHTIGTIRVEQTEVSGERPWITSHAANSGDRREPSRGYWLKWRVLTYQQTVTKPSKPPLTLHPQPYSKYRELSTRTDADPAEFRVLKLQPGKGLDPLYCELLHVSLDEHPPYDALSYCWGSPDPTVAVHCDGLALAVATNLGEALRAFRHETSPRFLWVDALCINQDDIQEKQHQVPLMGRIYHGASNVVIWLGSDTPNHTIASAFSILTSVRQLCDRFGWDVDLMQLARYHVLEDYGLPDIVDESWKSVRDLVERPWFSRTWIIQEVVLARRAYLHCGDSSIPFADFCVGLTYLSLSVMSRRPDMIPSVSAYAQATQLIMSYHKAGGLNRDIDLLALLENHRVARASDARDKVYGFLGLYELATGRRHTISADYHRTAAEVFIEAAKEIIHHSDTLDILGVPRQDLQHRMIGLPSWVPDWSAYEFGSSLSLRSPDGTYMFNFDASRVRATKNVTIRDNTLELSGYCFDEVVKVGKVMDPRLHQDGPDHLRIVPGSTALHILALITSWFKLAGAFSSESYPTGEDRFDAVVRAIFLDHFIGGNSREATIRFFKQLLVPLYALRNSGSEDSPPSLEWRLSTQFWSVLGRMVGPRFIDALAKLIRRGELKMQWYGYVSMGQPQRKTRHDDYLMTGIPRVAYRRMFCTNLGYIGVGPRILQEGDRVFLVEGSKVPLVLRLQVKGWELIGDCYMHGIMQGEAFNIVKCNQITII